jgi:tRNA (guanine37-N1)-methyltransferase
MRAYGRSGKLMRLDILTLFPGMFQGPLTESILQRAAEHGLVSIHIHDIRNFAEDKHHTADDAPFGGGAGMVMKCDPIFKALDFILPESERSSVPIILLTPQGRLFKQEIAHELSKHSRLVLICGHYEGIDERVGEHLATDQISIGDYVLTSGEIAAMVVADSVLRLIPGVLGSEASLMDESHTGNLLEYPQYTRPEVYRGWRVPEILISGNHGKISDWRRQKALKRTLLRRPDLLANAELSAPERKMLKALKDEIDEVTT